MYSFRPLAIQRFCFPNATWEVKSSEKSIYLTFDDGPTQQVTEYVLEALERYQAKATFFVVGRQVIKNPEILVDIRSHGHSVGNHTFSHVNGWGVSTRDYLEEVDKMQVLLRSHDVNATLFRPPYGRITFNQARQIRMRRYLLVMWSLLSGDFDPSLNITRATACLKRQKAGGVIVFHDSQKAFKNLRHLLPETLRHFSNLGYQFKTLS